MDLPLLVGVVFWAAVVALAGGLWRRSRLWRAGRPAAWRWHGVLSIPKRYLVDLHHVVAREPFVARAHAATAGGAVLALVAVALNYGFALRWAALDAVLLLAGLAMGGGAAAMAWRRRDPPARLSRGAWSRLPYSLLLFAAALVAVALAGPALAPWFAAAIVAALALGAAELALGIGAGGPMKHAVAGLLHLGMHPRPERFAMQPAATALQPLPLRPQALGIAAPRDFAWNRLLSFDACVQCGKCEAACPARAAGQPLDPKQLIQDLVTAMATRPGEPLVPRAIGADTLWSCTTCRACVQECPMLIEHVDAVVGLRRHLALADGTVPNHGATVLQQLRETDTQGGHPLAARQHWAVDLDLPVLAPGGTTDWLLLVGEGGFDLRYQRTLRALARSLKQADVQFALLGAAETDCGDLARRLGDEAGFERLARQLIATLAARDFRRIVTPDPHLFHSLKHEYPALGAHLEVWHHTQLLAELLAQGRLQPRRAATDQVLTYHDPCYLGRYGGEVDAPRAALERIGITVVEMERHAQRGRCCGGGGGAPHTDVPGKTRIPDIRIADARSAGAGVVAVACPQCTAMLEGVSGPRPQVLDIAELVAHAVGADA
jgi:Fe-S oxidoreductase